VDDGLGAFGLGGAELRWGGWHLEGALGLGLEPAGYVTITGRTFTPPGGTPDSFTSETPGTGSAFSARATVTLARQVTPSWDLVLRVGIHHVVDVRRIDNPIMSFASSIGMRLNLP
jgi:hypothetical protein